MRLYEVPQNSSRWGNGIPRHEGKSLEMVEKSSSYLLLYLPVGERLTGALLNLEYTTNSCTRPRQFPTSAWSVGAIAAARGQVEAIHRGPKDFQPENDRRETTCRYSCEITKSKAKPMGVPLYFVVCPQKHRRYNIVAAF